VRNPISQLLCGWTNHSWQRPYGGIWDDSACHWCGKTNPAHEQQPSSVIEHRTTEILAWRGWDLYDEAYLWSYGRTRWDGPTLTADKKPDPNHNHGLYAVKDQQCSNWCSYSAYRDVIGEVALSGLVVEGETGYRAEHCTIRKLSVQRVPPKRVPLEFQAELEERYQCEVELDLRESLWPGVSSAMSSASTQLPSQFLQGVAWPTSAHVAASLLGTPGQQLNPFASGLAPSLVALFAQCQAEQGSKGKLRTERFSESLWLPKEVV